jgi:hypothetical protein
VPGRTFPVTALFLEDALEVTNHKVAPNAEWARRGPGEKKNRFRGGAAGGMSPGAGGLCFDFTQVRVRIDDVARLPLRHDFARRQPPCGEGRPWGSMAEKKGGTDEFGILACVVGCACPWRRGDASAARAAGSLTATTAAAATTTTTGSRTRWAWAP